MSTSAFGEELRKGLPLGNTVDYRGKSIASKISYAGTNTRSFDLDSLLADISSADSSEDYR